MKRPFFNLDKTQAAQALMDGNRISHLYYLDGEFLYMRDGRIMTEEDYDMGTFSDEFWNKYQPWRLGWGILSPSN